MGVISDQIVLDAIYSGDNDKVLAVLYEKTLPKIQRYILRNSGDMDDVRDVFQDAVIVLITKVKLREFNQKYEIDGFLYAVARNKWINKAKVAKRMVNTDYEMEQIDDSQDCLGTLISNEKDSAVHQILESVGEPCTKLLKLTILHEYSLKDVMEEMGYSSTNVAKTYNYRCKKKLVDKVKKNKYFQRLLERKL